MEFHQTVPSNVPDEFLANIPSKWEIGGDCPRCGDGTLELVDKGDDLPAQKKMAEWGDGQPARFAIGCTHTALGSADQTSCDWREFSLDRR